MDRKERLNKAYDYLKWKHIITKQADVAESIKSTKQNVSAALLGKPAVLTEQFIVRFCKAYPEISVKWLLDGIGDMLADQPDEGVHYPEVVSESEMTERLIQSYERVQRLQKQHIDTLRELLDEKKEKIKALEQEIEALKNSKKPPKRWGDSGMVADDNLPLK